MAAERRKREKAKEDLPLENSILYRLMAEQAHGTAEEDSSGDVAVVFCGVRRSGKTSIIDRFINPNKDDRDEPKSTVALDYRFARYTGDNAGTTQRTVAHIFEIGGEESLNKELTGIPLSACAHLANLLLVVCVDLSDPGGAVAALDRWLTTMRPLISDGLEVFGKQSEGAAKKVEMVKQARRDVFNEHPDADKVKPFPVPLVIFATKADLVLDQDVEKRKAVCKALRFIALMNGAHLLFTSTKEKATMNNMKGLLRQAVFNVPMKGGVPEQLEVSKPLSIGAAKDRSESIGMPPGAADHRGDRAWVAFILQLFPEAAAASAQAKKSEAEALTEELPKFCESTVDGMVEQRLEELAQYRKQVERNKRLASEGVELKADVTAAAA